MFALSLAPDVHEGTRRAPCVSNHASLSACRENTHRCTTFIEMCITLLYVPTPEISFMKLEMDERLTRTRPTASHANRKIGLGKHVVKRHDVDCSWCKTLRYSEACWCYSVTMGVAGFVGSTNYIVRQRYLFSSFNIRLTACVLCRART